MEEKSLKDTIKEMNEANRKILEQLDDKKKPKGWAPGLFGFKAKLGKKKLKQGYAIVQKIDDNKGVDFVKCQVSNGTFKLEDTYHAVADYDIFHYRGKPFIFQPKKKLNPFNPLEGKNQTYGQKYIMARMTSDIIKPKLTVGNVGWWIFVLVVIGIIAYSFSGA